MGEICLCVAIEPDDDINGVCDWRSIPDNDRRISSIELPTDIHSKCRDLMKLLDIEFGCIDILLTPSGDYIFLEVNENGQFFWVELQDNNVQMLKTFCEFVTGLPCSPPSLLEIFEMDTFKQIYDYESDLTIQNWQDSLPLP
jgi:hypothetical protein